MLADPTDLLLNLNKRSQDIRRKLAGGGWTLREGVKIYVNPEARCPLCERPFPTNRVWVVDEAAWRLPKLYRLKDGSAVPPDGNLYHPHVQDGGSYMCRGNSKTPAQLLFNGIHEEYNPAWFLWDMGHECETFKFENCPICEARTPTFALNKGYGGRGMCSAQCLAKAKATRCSRCFKDRKADKEHSQARHGNYCLQCFDFVYPGARAAGALKT